MKLKNIIILLLSFIVVFNSLSVTSYADNEFFVNDNNFELIEPNANVIDYNIPLATSSDGYISFFRPPEDVNVRISYDEYDLKNENDSNYYSYRENGVYQKVFDMSKFASFVFEYYDKKGKTKKNRYSFKKSNDLDNYYRIEFEYPSDFESFVSFYIDYKYTAFPKNTTGNFTLVVADYMYNASFLYALNPEVYFNAYTKSNYYTSNSSDTLVRTTNNKGYYFYNLQNFKFDKKYKAYRVFFHGLSSNVDRRIVNGVKGKFILDFFTNVSFNVNDKGIVENNDNDNVGANIADMSDTMNNVSDGINAIAESQNLVLDSIKGLVQHISNQLFAFWNQLAGEFTNLYRIMGDKDKNNADHIVNSIDNSSVNITNKLESNKNELKENANQNTDRILEKSDENTEKALNGYDNSSMNDSNSKLNEKLKEQENAEKQLMNQVENEYNNFEYDNPILEYLAVFKLLSKFLQDLFDSLGAYKDVVRFSFMISIAMIFIGMYRFKGGA